MELVGVRPKTRECWENCFESKHMKRALRYKPGLLGVAHYYLDLNSLSDVAEAEAEYLSRKEKDPVKTDTHYRNKIISNILFKGLRSA